MVPTSGTVLSTPPRLTPALHIHILTRVTSFLSSLTSTNTRRYPLNRDTSPNPSTALPTAAAVQCGKQLDPWTHWTEQQGTRRKSNVMSTGKFSSGSGTCAAQMQLRHRIITVSVPTFVAGPYHICGKVAEKQPQNDPQ